MNFLKKDEHSMGVSDASIELDAQLDVNMLLDFPINRRQNDTRSRISIRLKTKHVRFEVFTAATMKNVVFWDVTTCGSCKNRRFGGT
jgi:hypothetical protein